jgi:membrane protease subunit (stomatin/prohibitin family)
MQVIQHQDPDGRTMVARVPSQGTEAVQLGSQLIVEQSQEAVFLRDGQALDTFGPGRHTLATQNLPLLTRLVGMPFGRSPFQVAVVFVSRRTFLDLKWGTKEPVTFRDRELAMVRLRAFGKFAVRIDDAQLFVNSIVGSMGLYATDGVESYFRDVIVARLNDLLGETLESIFDLPRLYDELAAGLKARVAEDFSRYGIQLVDLIVGAVTPPPEVQQRIDERSGMAAVGDLDAYLKFKAAGALGDAARGGGEAGGAVGAGVGVGMGAGVGMMLPSMMKEAMTGGGGAAGGQAGGGGGPAAAASAGGSEGARTAGDRSAAKRPAGDGPTGESPPPGDRGATPAFCFNCGAALPAGARFCPDCGTRVSG